jgi:hypothetical protein
MLSCQGEDRYLVEKVEMVGYYLLYHHRHHLDQEGYPLVAAAWVFHLALAALVCLDRQRCQVTINFLK